MSLDLFPYDNNVFREALTAVSTGKDEELFEEIMERITKILDEQPYRHDLAELYLDQMPGQSIGDAGRQVPVI